MEGNAHLRRDDDLGAVDLELLEDAAHLALRLSIAVDLGLVRKRAKENVSLFRGGGRSERKRRRRRRAGTQLTKEVDAVVERLLDQLLNRVALDRAADREPAAVREAARSSESVRLEEEEDESNENWTHADTLRPVLPRFL